MFWSFQKDENLDASAEGIPAKSKIEINYTDGYKKPTRYSDVFELNAALLFGTAEPKNLWHIHQEIKFLREGSGFS